MLSAPPRSCGQTITIWHNTAARSVSHDTGSSGLRRTRRQAVKDQASSRGEWVPKTSGLPHMCA